MLVAAMLPFATSVIPSHAATTTIFVNGTRPSTYEWPNAGYPDDSKKMLQGFFANSDNDVVIAYARSLGIMTAPNDPGYDKSVTEATDKTVVAIVTARMNDPTGHIDVVGESQGADGVSRALKILEGAGYDTSNITFYVAGNIDNNDGGLMTRLMPLINGLHIPLIGVTYGQSTQTQYSHVVQVTNEFDGATDLPVYPLNLLAVLNAFLGSFKYDRHTYDKTDITDPNNIVTTTPDGLLTNILIPDPVGQLAITRPLLDMGVPQSIVTALDPFLRALINTGYDRPDPSKPGTYPDHPVGFRLLPSPAEMVHDVVMVLNGLNETLHQLGALAWQAINAKLHPKATTPAPTSSVPATSSPDVVAAVSTSSDVSVAKTRTDAKSKDDARVHAPKPLKKLPKLPHAAKQNTDGQAPEETPADTTPADSKEHAPKDRKSGDGVKHALDAVHKATHAPKKHDAPSADASKPARPSRTHHK